MANSLINGTNTELKEAIDSVISSMFSIGSDFYEYGKKYISSRLIKREANTKYQLLYAHNGDLQINGDASNINGVQGGVLPFILNSDITSDMFEKLRINPACNFSDGTIKNDVLIGYGSHSNVVNDDDSRHGYIQIPDVEVEGASRNNSFKQLLWTNGHAKGTFKQLLIGVDVCGDITSGINVYRTYYPQNGFPCNVTGITEEYEITDENNYKINILTGKRTKIPVDSPLKNIGCPAYFRDVVEIGDYIYFIDTGGFIEKIDKNTLALVHKSSYTQDYSSSNLFKIGDKLYVYEMSSYSDPYIS